MKIRASWWWTASTIGASASIRSLVSTRVMPGDVRPSGRMQELPWMISPTPWRAFSPKWRAYVEAAAGPDPAPSSTGARYSRLRTVVPPMASGVDRIPMARVNHTVPWIVYRYAMAAGDPAFEDVFDRLFPRAVRLTHRILGDRAAAEDAAAEALARAYARWPRLRGVPWLDGWVLR